MKESEIKAGMKVKLVSQKQGNVDFYSNYGYKIGDIFIVKGYDNSITKIGETYSHYCIPTGYGNKYSNCFKPITTTLKEFLRNGI